MTAVQTNDIVVRIQSAAQQLGYNVSLSYNVKVRPIVHPNSSANAYLNGAKSSCPLLVLLAGCGSSRLIGLLLEERTETDGERAERVCGTAREERATSAGGDRGDGREGADGDEYGGDRSHHLGVLVREELKRRAGVDQPYWDVRYVGDS